MCNATPTPARLWNAQQRIGDAVELIGEVQEKLKEAGIRLAMAEDMLAAKHE